MKNSIQFTIIASAFLLSCSRESAPVSGGTPLGGNNPPPHTTTYTDPQIVEMVQKDALKYFWDFAESNSKLARERYHTDNPGLDATIVSTGGL